MAVRCSKCGEELLGAVNRCWKCGQQFTAQPETDGLPPVRSAPMDLQSDVVMAELADVVAAPSPTVPPMPAIQPAAVSGVSKPVRTGSPFVPGAMMQPVTTPSRPHQPVVSPRTARIPGPPGHDPVAVAGAITSIMMGLFALSIAWMKSPVPISGAVLIALIGFSTGIWGLYSKRRGWALLGILISCAAIGLASYSGAIVVYESLREHDEQIQGDSNVLP